MARIPLVAILTALVAGCGGGDDDDGAVEPVNCADEPRADIYVANMDKIGEGGQLGFVLVSSDPGPPAKGDNEWVIEVVDGDDQPVSGATITVTPFMPDHGHGTPIDVVVTPDDGDGRYGVGPVNLWMPGLWEVTVDAQSSAGDDSAVFAFCIEG